MSLQEVVVIDKVEVLQDGHVQVRQLSAVERNGLKIAETYQRWTLWPGQDVSDQDAKVQAICAAAWTPEIVSAYEASQTKR